MDGQPVWLASLSRRNPATKKIIPVPRWTPDQFDDSTRLLMKLLHGAGDPRRERVFRMNVTLCVHRALRDDEVAKLPRSFWAEGAAGLAGGPVQVLSETVVGSPSTRPCHNPTRVQLPGETDPDLWIPVDCGTCSPCLARRRIEVVADLLGL